MGPYFGDRIQLQKWDSVGYVGEPCRLKLFQWSEPGPIS
jgi:hypothetical protein